MPATAAAKADAPFPFRMPVRVEAPVPPYATESVELAESIPEVSWARPVPPPETVSVPPESWMPLANVLVAAVPVMLRYVD